MKLGIENQIAIVTGGSKGIGQQISIALAKEGAVVAVCARASEALKNTVQEIQAAGGKAEAFPVDVTKNVAVGEIVNQIAQKFGRVDILVNNVGGALPPGDFLGLSDEDWRNTYELNVMSVVRFIRSTVPYLRTSTRKRIINIASISGIQPGFYNPHYASSKAAVINLSKHLANVFAKEKILVNCICPGPIPTPSWDSNLQRLSEEEHRPIQEIQMRVEKEEQAKIPLGVLGKASDVGALVAYLASDHAGWITGSCFHINGGKLGAAL